MEWMAGEDALRYVSPWDRDYYHNSCQIWQGFRLTEPLVPPFSNLGSLTQTVHRPHASVGRGSPDKAATQTCQVDKKTLDLFTCSPQCFRYPRLLTGFSSSCSYNSGLALM